MVTWRRRHTALAVGLALLILLTPPYGSDVFVWLWSAVYAAVIGAGVVYVGAAGWQWTVRRLFGGSDSGKSESSP